MQWVTEFYKFSDGVIGKAGVGIIFPCTVNPTIPCRFLGRNPLYILEAYIRPAFSVIYGVNIYDFFVYLISIYLSTTCFLQQVYSYLKHLLKRHELNPKIKNDLFIK